MARLQDEPLADPVCVPIYYLSKLARDHGCIVCQAGEGADELFCGYPLWLRFLQLQSADRLPVPSVIKRLGLGALAAAGKDQTVHYEWLRRGANGNPVFWGGEEAYTHVAETPVASPRFAETVPRPHFVGRDFADPGAVSSPTRGTSPISTGCRI